MSHSGKQIFNLASPGESGRNIEVQVSFEAEVSVKAQTTMTHQLFGERDHAALYQKYRYSPPGEVKDIIIQYLDKKVQYVIAKHVVDAQ